LLRLAFRCFFLQCSWNYRQFQGLGWSVVLLPELKYLHGVGQLPSVLKGYLKYFNTNTFLASSVAGATIALEVDQCKGKEVPIAAHQYAEAVMAPVAAVGDALFWGGGRSLVCCLAVALAAYGFWWAPIFLLVLFNLPAGVLRIVGVWLGYHHGAAVVSMVQRGHLADVALVLKRCMIVVLGAVCAVLVHGEHFPQDSLLLVHALVGVTLLTAVFCLRKGVPTAVVLWSVVAGVVIVDKMLM